MILINLLPEELRKRETVKLALPELPSKTTITRVILGLISIQILLTIFSIYQHFLVLPGLQKQVNTLKAQIQETVSEKEETIQIKAKLKQISDATDQQFYWSSFLNTLTGSVTKGVWLDYLSLDESRAAATKRKKQEVKAAPKKAEKKSKKKDAKAKKDAAKAKADKTKQDAKADEEAAVKKMVLKLKGSVYAPGQETATVGSFLKELKSNRSFSDFFDEIELGTVNQRKVKEYDVYDFEITGKNEEESCMKKLSANVITDFINSRNSREKIMFMFLFIAAIFALNYILLIQPVINLFMNELPLQKSLKLELTELKEDQKNQELIKKNYLELKTKYADVLATFIENDQVPELLENLSTIASGAGVRIVTIKPSPESTIDTIPGFSLLPIEMTATGGTHALGNFLYRLEKDKMFYRVENLTIQSNPTDPSRHQITLKIETYRKSINEKV